jgi:hypothetical protein
MRAGFTLTITEPGITPLAGVAASQVPPEVEAENDVLPPEPERLSLCEGGNEPPA